LKSCIKEEDWYAAKYNGSRLIKIAEENKTILANAKTLLSINDAQVGVLVKYLKSNYPEV